MMLTGAESRPPVSDFSYRAYVYMKYPFNLFHLIIQSGSCFYPIYGYFSNDIHLRSEVSHAWQTTIR